MKQEETLEEVSKSHAIYELENNYKPTKESFKLACKRNFIKGAKWQQEQICTSEFIQRIRATKSDAEARRIIREQFKKK